VEVRDACKAFKETVALNNVNVSFEIGKYTELSVAMVRAKQYCSSAYAAL